MENSDGKNVELSDIKKTSKDGRFNGCIMEKGSM
jgi:hypothetical protein